MANRWKFETLLVAIGLILASLVSAAQSSSHLIAPGVGILSGDMYLEIASHAPAGSIPHEWK